MTPYAHMTNRASAWFRVDRAPRQVELRVFCFPYAGGTSLTYLAWAQLLPPTVHVVPVELPGRGARLHEPPFVSLPDLIDALAEVITPLLDKPFAFFGHSMGAVIAFELARRLRRQHAVEPQKLFVSGRRAPQVPDDGPVTYNLPNDELIEELQRLDGTPKEVLEHAELMELLIPLLRADFQLVQTYEYLADAPLRCPITVYSGLQDINVTREVLLAWEEQTHSRFALRMLPGDHFFLRSSQRLLLESLGQELSEVIARSRVNSAAVQI